MRLHKYNNMQIAVDGNEANVQEKVGVSVYTFELLKYFQAKANADLNFIVFLRSQPNDDLPRANEYFKYEVIPGRFLWSQLFLPIYLYKNKFSQNPIDILFSPAHYAPRFCPVKSIVTIHDLSYFYYPNDFLKKDLYKLKNWTAYSVKNASKIIAVSKTTKKDLVKYYPVTEDKIEVIYNGYEKLKYTRGVNSRLHKGVEEEKYILYVGTLQSRKNLIVLIRAFEKFKKNYPYFKLVIAGKKGWLYVEIFNEVEKLNLKDDVIFTGYIKNEEIVDLYKHAFCFILPSLYEGFGIPVLEAMSYSCPVISSFTSSLPEVGGDSSLYFDPTSEKDLFEKMQMLKEDPEIRKELIAKGRERIKMFSWSKCAEETLNILKSV